MRTDTIDVSGKQSAVEKALREAETVATYKKLSPKGALHLRLLTEELMGLMRSITGETQGTFWIEDDQGVYQLHLKTETRMSSVKRSKLLSSSTSGKNEAARGLMGRLRDMFDQDSDSDMLALSPMMSEGFYEHSTASMVDLEWSMMRYRNELEPHYLRNEAEAIEAWDELEKSVVAHVADEIKVFIRGDRVEIVIYKELA